MASARTIEKNLRYSIGSGLNLSLQNHFRQIRPPEHQYSKLGRISRLQARSILPFRLILLARPAYGDAAAAPAPYIAASIFLAAGRNAAIETFELSTGAAACDAGDDRAAIVALHLAEGPGRSEIARRLGDRADDRGQGRHGRRSLRVQMGDRRLGGPSRRRQIAAAQGSDRNRRP